MTYLQIRLCSQNNSDEAVESSLKIVVSGGHEPRDAFFDSSQLL